MACGGEGHPSSAEGFEGLSDEERAVLIKVAEVPRKLRFGTVLLVVQDGS